MTCQEATARANRMAAALRKNSDDYHFERIDHDTFHTRQRATWASESDETIIELVLAILRSDPERRDS